MSFLNGKDQILEIEIKKEWWWMSPFLLSSSKMQTISLFLISLVPFLLFSSVTLFTHFYIQLERKDNTNFPQSNSSYLPSQSLTQWHKKNSISSANPHPLNSACMLSGFSFVWPFVTLWIVAHQAPQSMGFSSQEYQNELPCLPPGDLPDLGMEPVSLMSMDWQTGSLSLVLPGTP